MKKVLYDHKDYYCIITSKENFSVLENEHWSEFNLSGNKDVSSFTLEMNGKNWEILWPNREGEVFFASQVFDKISRYNATEGLTITYPATASCRTLIFMEKNGNGFTFLAPPDEEGKVTNFRIDAKNNRNTSINIKGANTRWYTLSFKTISDLKNRVKDLQSSVPWRLLHPVQTNSNWQVQTGLIDSDGNTEVPKNKGFNILSDISELMLRVLGENNLLHVFGYSMGHDRGYPDYTPSRQLGGKSSLEKSIKAIHQHRQKAVFYMNGRIADQESVEKDGLYNSVLKDYNNLPIREVYHSRNFFVMNPLSEEWQTRLFSEAIALKELGADGIQLDQLGGRAAPVSAGEIWGKGYINLINSLHKENLSVWIQGLSDIYPADWFELTHRDVNILEDGTIRGGTPLGKPDKRVFQISVPNQVLLIPQSKIETRIENNKTHKDNIIIDLNLGGEKLFLYNSSYMAQLEKLMHKAVLNR